MDPRHNGGRPWIRAILLLAVLALLAGIAALPGGFQWRAGRSPVRKVMRQRTSLSATFQANLLPAVAPVVINEIGLAHAQGPTDMSGNPADWVELYNNSDHPIRLKGCTLTDTPARPRKYRLPDILLPARSPLLLWADGQNRLVSSMAFTLHKEGAWRQIKAQADNLSGTAWYSSNNPARAAAPLEGYLRIYQDPADFCLWLRARNPGRQAALLEYQVDRCPPAHLTLEHTPDYQTVKLENPDDPAGNWPMAVAMHTITLAARQGELLLASVVATRSNAVFGLKDPSLHTNFRLNNQGELVALYSPQGMALDYVNYPAMPRGQSYQRQPDGANQFVVAPPTPDGYAQVLPPRLSSGSAYLDGPIALAAQAADPRDTIRYTLDSALPTELSPVFPASLVITQRCVVRARAFRPDALPSVPATRMFWMGPRPRMPALWLVVDERNLYSPQWGMMRNIYASGVMSERACHAALFYPDGQIQETPGGLRLQGRSSRARMPIRFFRFTCRARYGRPHWPGAIFPGAGPSNEVSFAIRANTLFNHPLGLDMMEAAGLPGPRYRHCLLYMNQEPYGVYYLLENVEREEYLQYQYGHTNLCMIKQRASSDPLIHGDMDEYNRTWGAWAMAANEQILAAEVAQAIDLEHFTRWIATAQYLDYGDNDQSYFVFDRTRPAPAWSYINWDLDGAFYYYWVGTTNPLTNARGIFGVRRRVFRALLQDPGYRAFYIDLFQRLLNHPFRPAAWQAWIDAREAEFMPHVDFEYQGMLSQNRHASKSLKRLVMNIPDAQYVRRDWEAQLSMLRSFQVHRPGLVRRQLQDEFGLPPPVEIRITTTASHAPVLVDGFPETLPYTGLYFPGTTLTLAPATNAAPDAQLQLMVNGDRHQTTRFCTKVTAALSVELLGGGP